MSKASSSSNGIGFGSLLLLLFVGLKLTGYIGWSWWWVLSPLWLPLVVVLGIWLIGRLLLGAAWVWDRKRR